MTFFRLYVGIHFNIVRVVRVVFLPISQRVPKIPVGHSQLNCPDAVAVQFPDPHELASHVAEIYILNKLYSSFRT